MKKIGIITIFNVENYGAELQAYATQKALQTMGYDAELINYPYFVSPRHKATKMSRPVFPISMKLHIIKKCLPLVNMLKGLRSGNANRNRTRHFEEFQTANTRLSKEYRTMDALYEANLGYDACIVGSDQVWNPNNNTSLDPYFLSFVSSGRKLSYASSIGVSVLPDYTYEYYRKAFNSLDAISVREEQAVGLVKQVSGKSAQWVLDPTLLLNKEQWLEVAKPTMGMPEKYVLLYELTPCPYLKILAKHIAEVKGCKVIRITKDANRVEADEDVVNVIDAGPAEFLGLFKGADFVVTNSFHGTAFSINFNKPFYVVTPARKSNNSRQQSILRLFGLTGRLLLDGAPLPTEGQFALDFAQVNARLEEERAKSMNYLTKAINGE